MLNDKERESISNLYNDIDRCISKLIKSRLDKNKELESEVYFEMEGLMVSTQQELSYLLERY